MISIFFFCTRQNNLDKILSIYENYEFIDEILVIHIENLTKKFEYSKAKFIHMPKNADLGLLSRYTFALSCKNQTVFIQDDDWLYSRDFFARAIDANSPLAGAHGRWFEDGKYKRKKEKFLTSAPIVLTTGVLVDTYYLPKVIEYSKDFWGNEYQKVFNGEDIFLSYAIGYITKIKEFPIFTNKKYYTSLDTEGKELSKDVNTPADRTRITKKIMKYFYDN